MSVNIANFIDHTLLRAEASVTEIEQLCREAKEHQFAAVCVNPCYVDLAAHLLRGSQVKVATVIGFPLGATLTAVKVYEATQAIRCKADELDMVINIGAAKLGLWETVTEEIRQVVEVAEGKTVKVIIETALLTDDEKRCACQSVLAGGAQYVKTSTGFSSGGATVADIRLLREAVGPSIGVKASGGIRTRLEAEAMIAAGATRLGTSAGVTIVE